jgi:hypothetical protein
MYKSLLLKPGLLNKLLWSLRRLMLNPQLQQVAPVLPKSTQSGSESFLFRRNWLH